MTACADGTRDRAAVLPAGAGEILTASTNSMTRAAHRSNAKHQAVGIEEIYQISACMLIYSIKICAAIIQPEILSVDCLIIFLSKCQRINNECVNIHRGETACISYSSALSSKFVSAPENLPIK